MKKILFLLLTLSVLFTVSDAQAQRRWKNEPGNKQRPEQLDKYRKIRLIEILNLKEEDAIRFFAKEDAHRETMREIVSEMDLNLDEIDQLVRDDKEIPELEKRVLLARDIQRRMNVERERYHDELKDLLSPLQFAKFLVFERNFGKRLRDAFDELHRGNRQKSDERK